jgi:hypothetical protein
VFTNPDGPEAADALERQAAEIERLREALERQCDNMSFAINRVDLRGWTEKFAREIAEDRAALTGKDIATLSLSGKTQTDARTRGDECTS